MELSLPSLRHWTKKLKFHSILQPGKDDTSAVPPLPDDEVRQLRSDVVAGAGDHRSGNGRRWVVVEDARRRRADAWKFNLFTLISDVGSREGEYVWFVTEISRKLPSRVPLTWTVDLRWWGRTEDGTFMHCLTSTQSNPDAHPRYKFLKKKNRN